MTEEDKEYRQGRSKERVRQTEIVAGIGIFVCILMIVILCLVEAIYLS